MTKLYPSSVTSRASEKTSSTRTDYKNPKILSSKIWQTAINMQHLCLLWSVFLCSCTSELLLSMEMLSLLPIECIRVSNLYSVWYNYRCRYAMPIIGLYSSCGTYPNINQSKINTRRNKRTNKNIIRIWISIDCYCLSVYRSMELSLTPQCSSFIL